MAGRPHEHEGTTLELDHLHTHTVTAASPASPRARVAASRACRRQVARVAPRAVRRRSASSASRMAVSVGRRRDVVRRERRARLPVDDPLANTVRAVGGAPAFGPSTGMQLNADLVDIAATPSGRGYWVAASDGGVFTFGDAHFYGFASPASRSLDRSSASPPRPSGNGYWLVGVRRRRLRLRRRRVPRLARQSGRHRSHRSSRSRRRRRARATGWSAPTVACSPSATPPSRARRPSFGARRPDRRAWRRRRPATATTCSAPTVACSRSATRTSRARPSTVSTWRPAIAIPRNGRGYEVARTDGSVVGHGGAPSVAAPVRPPRRVSTRSSRIATAAGRRRMARDELRPAARRSQSQSLVAGSVPASARVRTSPTAPAATARSARTACTAARTNSCARRGTTSPAPPAAPTSSVSTRPRRRPPTRTSSRCSCSSTRAPAPWGGRCGGLQ